MEGNQYSSGHSEKKFSRFELESNRQEYQGFYNRDQEYELIRKAQAGNELAFAELCEAYLPFIVSRVREFQGRGVEFHDLLQQGYVGFCIAVNHFDFSKQVKLSTYAYLWIKSEVKRMVVSSGMLHLSIENHTRLAIARRLLEDEKWSRQEVAEELDISLKKLDEILSVRDRPLSLSQSHQYSDHESGSLEMVVPNGEQSPEDDAIAKDSAEHIYQWMPELSRVEQEVLSLRDELYGQSKHTLEHVAKILTAKDIDQTGKVWNKEAVRQVEISAKGKLEDIANQHSNHRDVSMFANSSQENSQEDRLIDEPTKSRSPYSG